jgi:hypothetical protein
MDFWKTDLEACLPRDLVGRSSELWAPLLCIAASLDHEKDPDIPYMEGEIAQSLLELQRVKVQKSRERVMGEDFDLKILEALNDVLKDGAPQFVEKGGVNWYNLNSLRSLVTEIIRDDLGDATTSVSKKRLASLLHSGLCREESSMQMKFNEGDKIVRRVAYSVIPEAVTSKIAAMKREAVKIEEPEPEQLETPF